MRVYIGFVGIFGAGESAGFLLHVAIKVVLKYDTVYLVPVHDIHSTCVQ